MREILFRGMTEQGEWFYGDLIQQHGNFYISPKCKKGNYPMSYGLGSIYASISGLREVKPEKVSQYTGLKDKNGKKIFEGDFLKIKANEYYSNENILLEEDCELCGNVIKYNGCFALRDGDMDDVLFWDLFEYDFDIEIIGNIHEERIG